MPAATSTNANSVPMLRQLDHLVDVRHRREHGHEHAGQDRGDVRRPVLRVHLRGPRRQQAVARHREEDARLAELEHQQHRGRGEHGAEAR